MHRNQEQRVASSRPSRKAEARQHGDYQFLLDLVRPYHGPLAFALVLMLAQSTAVLVMPWLAGRFSAAMVAGGAVGGMLLLAFVLIVIQAALGYVVGVRTQSVAVHLIADASARVFDHLQSLPLGWHHERRRGEVLSLLIEDTQRLGYFVTSTLIPLLPLLLTCAGAFVMMLRIEPRIAVAVAALVPAIFIGLRWAGRRLRPLANQAMEAYALKSALAEQNLAMMPVVKSYLGEQGESLRFSAQNHRLRDLEIRQLRLQSAIGPLVQVAGAACVIALLWISSRGVAAGTLTPAELVTILLYGLLLTQPVSQLASVYGQVQTARGTAARLIEAFAASPEPDDGTQALQRVRGEVVFENVSFTYPGRDALLRGLELQLQAGETIALTGVNGAGKSSLVHLLMRFSDPDAGRILLDGLDIREATLKSLRTQIALVSQNVLLFNASIADNIAYGLADASQKQVEAAARSARAHDFIAALPQGYATLVGDQGVRLSGGQKQRISLARALIKDPAILVLDEATAMFDPVGEQEFIAHCRDLMTTRTVILITHRPASLALADRVLCLQEGKLQELLEAPGQGITAAVPES